MWSPATGSAGMWSPPQMQRMDAFAQQAGPSFTPGQMPPQNWQPGQPIVPQQHAPLPQNMPQYGADYFGLGQQTPMINDPRYQPRIGEVMHNFPAYGMMGGGMVPGGPGMAPGGGAPGGGGGSGGGGSMPTGSAGMGPSGGYMMSPGRQPWLNFLGKLPGGLGFLAKLANAGLGGAAEVQKGTAMSQVTGQKGESGLKSFMKGARGKGQSYSLGGYGQTAGQGGIGGLYNALDPGVAGLRGGAASGAHRFAATGRVGNVAPNSNPWSALDQINANRIARIKASGGTPQRSLTAADRKRIEEQNKRERERRRNQRDNPPPVSKHYGGPNQFTVKSNKSSGGYSSWNTAGTTGRLGGGV